MLDGFEKLDASGIRAECHYDWADLSVFDSLASTNSWLKTQSLVPAVCLAESQTKGRGRNGNQWRSPNAENIYLSFNWQFPKQLSHLPLLSLAVGLAVAESIESLGVSGHGVKWPNDLYWEDKKLGGILIETSNASSQVIVGIGINVNSSHIEHIDQPWISLSLISGKKINRNKFVSELLNRLSNIMQHFPQLSPEALLNSWECWDVVRGKYISFETGDGSCEGIACGIDESGYLLVDMGEGQLRAFNSSISKVRW